MLFVNETVIDSVDVFPLEAPLEEPFGYSQGWVTARTATLVRITASDETTGWGECFGPLAGTGDIIERLLAPELVGEDPSDVEGLYDRCYAVARRGYQSMVPYPALSGVDIALWDLRGKRACKPIASHIGEVRREWVPAYATGHYFHRDVSFETQCQRIVEEARDNAKALGAIKLKIGLGLVGLDASADLTLVERVVDAIPAGTTVMVDANYAYDELTAMRVGEALASLDVRWFEEPVAPEDEIAYRSLHEQLSIPIAGGECWDLPACNRIIRAGAVDILQPDICAIGGLTPVTQLAKTLEPNDSIQLIPHVWGTPIAQAASLHLLATLPTTSWIEWDRSANPLREQLVPEPPRVDDSGAVVVPSGPGLGVTPEESALEEYAA